MKTKTLILAVVALFLLLNASLMGLYLLTQRESAAPVGVLVPEALPVIKKLPTFTLTSDKGTPFSPEDLAGKVWVADFIFTSCPGPCPIMTRNMAGVAETLKMISDVAFVSISVDPETDTPEVLAKYGAQHGADPTRWHFLTGTPEAIQSVAAEGFMVGAIDDPMIHSSKFCLVDRAGQIRGYFTGTDEDDIDRLITAVHQLLKEETP